MATTAAASLRSGTRAPLSREARDTVFMLAVIGWTVLPHLWRLPIWVSVLCAGVLTWRGVLAVRQSPLPGRWWLVLLLVGSSALIWQSERTLIGKEAGVMLLVVLMTLKTLELRARRDALVVFFLGFFLVLTNFLYSQSLAVAAGMLVSVWGWLTALTLAHMPAGRPLLREAAGLSARAALVGLPVMLALFLFFPRLPPLWAVQGNVGASGLSNEMRIGDVNELALDDTIAMRVRFDGAAPPQSQLYFRGPVLSRYDGERWHAEPAPLRPATGNSTSTGSAGRRYAYELTVEAQRTPWLPLLEFTPLQPRTTPQIDTLAPVIDRAGQWRLRRPLGERVRIDAVAYPDWALQDRLSVYEHRALVELPVGHHPRTMAWALALRNLSEFREADPATLVAAVLRHIRTQPYRYTLSPGVYEGDVVDEFWMDRRAGFCEHYAAAFVVVMRAMDIPARVVTGFQGTDRDPVDGYYIVRNSHAHAWAEYWDGTGWVRADPTAAVAPERIESGLSLPAPSGFVAGSLDRLDPGLRLNLQRWLESMDNRWNQWVLNYGRHRQYDLLEHLGLEAPDGMTLLRVLGGIVAVAAALGALWAWWDQRRLTPMQRLRQRMGRHLRGLGVTVQAHEGPATWAAELRHRCGEPAERLVTQLHALERQLYGPQAAGGPSPAWWRTFAREVEALRARRA